MARYRGETIPMPGVIGLEHIAQMTVWPVSAVAIRAGRVAGMTDVMLHFVEPIRLGRHNARRVRYDGALYVTYSEFRIYLCGACAWDAWELIGHVYGLDRAADEAHNRTLRGY